MTARWKYIFGNTGIWSNMGYRYVREHDFAINFIVCLVLDNVYFRLDLMCIGVFGSNTNSDKTEQGNLFVYHIWMVNTLLVTHEEYVLFRTNVRNLYIWGPGLLTHINVTRSQTMLFHATPIINWHGFSPPSTDWVNYCCSCQVSCSVVLTWPDGYWGQDEFYVA